jgi:hypothetical protein
MPLKEGLSLRQPGVREPVNNLRPSIRQHVSISASLCQHHLQASRQKRVKPAAGRGPIQPVQRTCKKVMTMCLIWHQSTCPILTKMRGMGTPTIKNRISQNQRVNRMASTRTMRISVGIMKQSFPVLIAMLPVYLRRSPTKTPSLEATPRLS